MLAASLWSAACRSPSDAVHLEMSIATPSVWAGSSVVLLSTGLVGADTLPRVLIGGRAVAVRYAAPDSLIATAPDTQAVLTIQVGLRDRGLVTVGTVTLAGGYVGYRHLPGLGGYPLAWPGYGVPTFLIPQVNGIAFVDPRSGSVVTRLTDSSYSAGCVMGAGPGVYGRIVVAAPVGLDCGPLVAMRPDLPWVARDTGPAWGAAPDNRFAAELSPDRWLAFGHHYVLSFSRDPGGSWTTTTPRLEEPRGIAVSPSGHRAVPFGFEPPGQGVPVFTPASPQPAFFLSKFSAVWGADFSEDGDTLFLVGVPTDSNSFAIPDLAVLSSSDGSVLRSVRHPPYGSSYAGTVVVDSGRPWLYVIGASAAVHVVDRATLALIATYVASPLPAGLGVENLYPMLAASERKLFLVNGSAYGGVNEPPLYIFEFDLMP